jgi:hypothetical protein
LLRREPVERIGLDRKGGCLSGLGLIRLEAVWTIGLDKIGGCMEDKAWQDGGWVEVRQGLTRQKAVWRIEKTRQEAVCRIGLDKILFDVVWRRGLVNIQ